MKDKVVDVALMTVIVFAALAFVFAIVIVSIMADPRYDVREIVNASTLVRILFGIAVFSFFASLASVGLMGGTPDESDSADVESF